MRQYGVKRLRCRCRTSWCIVIQTDIYICTLCSQVSRSTDVASFWVRVRKASARPAELLSIFFFFCCALRVWLECWVTQRQRGARWLRPLAVLLPHSHRFLWVILAIWLIPAWVRPHLSSQPHILYPKPHSQTSPNLTWLQKLTWLCCLQRLTKPANLCVRIFFTVRN